MINKLFSFFFMIVIVACQKNTAINDLTNIDAVISLDEQFLILDANKDTSTAATESIDLGTVSSTTTVGSNKTVTVFNQSGANITFNFTDLETQLAANKRISIISNACKTAGFIKTTKSCSIIFALTYQPTEDYSTVISSQIVTNPSNLLYGKINLSGSISLPPALRQINTVFEITPIASQSYTLSPQKLMQTNTFTLTNISTRTVALATTAPLIVVPSSNGGVITRNGCISGTTPVLLKVNTSCTFDIQYTYDSTKTTFIDQLTLTATNATLDASSYSLPITVTNNTPVTTPPDVLQFSQSQIISSLSNSTDSTKLTITNISGKNGITAVSVDPTILSIPDPFILVSTSCTTTLKTALSCDYIFKIDTTKTVNMSFVERKIKTIGSSGFIYAGNTTPTIAEDKISCLTGYSLSTDGLSCILTPVQKTITINKKIGNTVSNSGTLTAANDTVIKLTNTSANSIIKSDSCLKSSATCSTTFLNTDIASGINLYIQYMADSAAISSGYSFKSFDNGGTILNSAVGTGNQLELKSLTSVDYILNVTYEPICTTAALQVAAVLETNLVQSNAADYKLNASGSKCIIKSCQSGYSVDAAGLNCTKNQAVNHSLIIKKLPLSIALKADAAYVITKSPLAPISGSVLKSEASKTLSVADGSSIAITSPSIDTGYKLKSIYSEIPSVACLTALTNDSCTINTITADETVIVELEPVDIKLNLAVNISGISTESATNITDLSKLHIDSIANINTSLNSNNVSSTCVEGSGTMADGSCAKNSDIYEFVNWTYSSGIIVPANTASISQAIGFDASQLIVTATANYRLKNTLYNDLVSNKRYEIYPLGTQNSLFDLDAQSYFPTKKEQNPNGSISGYYITSVKKGATQIEVLSYLTVVCLNSSNVPIPTKYYGSTSLTSYNGTLLSGVTNYSTMTAAADLKSCKQIIIMFPEDATDDERSDSFVITTKMTSSLINPQTNQPFELNQTLNININPNNDILPNVAFKNNVTNTQIINNHIDSRPYNIKTINGVNLKALYGGTNNGLVSNAEEGNRPEFFTVPAISDNTSVRVEMNVSNLEAAHSNVQYTGSIRVFDDRNACQYINNQNMVLGSASNYSTTYVVRTARSNVVQDAGACANVDPSYPTPDLPERYDFIGNDDFTCDANEFCFDNSTARTYYIRARALSSDNEATFVGQVVRVEVDLPGANPKLAVATTVRDSTGSMVSDSGNKVKKNDPVNFTAISDTGSSVIENCGTNNAECQFKIVVFKETENNLSSLNFDFYNKNVVFETELSSNVTQSYTPTTTGVYNVLMIAYNTTTKRTNRALSIISVQNNYHDVNGMASLKYLVETLPSNAGYKIYLDNDYTDTLSYTSPDVGFWGFSVSKLTAVDKTIAIRYFNDQSTSEVVLAGSKVAIIKLPNVNTSEYEALVKMHYKNPTTTSSNDDSPFYQFIKIHKCTNSATPIFDPSTATCIANPCGTSSIGIATSASISGQVSEILALGSGGFECQ